MIWFALLGLIAVLIIGIVVAVCAYLVKAGNELMKCPKCHELARSYQLEIRGESTCRCGTGMKRINDNPWTRQATELRRISVFDLKDLYLIYKEQREEVIRQEELDSYRKWMERWTE